MKKLIKLFIAIVIMLPVVVLADAYKPNIYYNKNVKVGERVDEYIILSNMEPGKIFELNYDTNYLEFIEGSAQIVFEGVELIKNKNASIEVSNGKIVFNVASLPTETYQDVIDGDLAVDSTEPSIYVSFKALKEGTTTIKSPSLYDVQNWPYFGTYAGIEISKAENETKKEESNEKVETKKDTTNEVVFYSSLGLNALLLVTLPIVAMRGKKAE